MTVPFLKLLGPRILSLRGLPRILSLIMLMALAACDTEDELNRQRLTAVKRERAMFASFSEALKQGDFNPGSGVVIAFVSGKTVNDALAGLTNVKVELPNTSGAVLTVNKVSADFRTGFPGLNLDATVERSGVRASAYVAATIDAEVDDKNPDVLLLKVHIDGLVPKVTWGPFDLGIRGFVRDLAQTKLDDLVNGPSVLGKVSVPLSRQFVVTVPGYSVQKDLPGAKVTISAPALSLTVKTSIEKIIFLPDGIHIFGRTTV